MLENSFVGFCSSLYGKVSVIMSSLLEPVINNDTQQYCVEVMKRLDYLRRNKRLCDVILEVESDDN